MATQLLKFKRSLSEITKVEKILGWGQLCYKDKSIRRKFKEKELWEIVELRNGEKIFLCKQFPPLTKKEALFLRSVLKIYQLKEQKNSVEKTLQKYCKSKLIELDEEQKKYFLKILHSLTSGFGPLNSIMKNTELEEIALVGLGKTKPVYVYHISFGWLKTNIYISKEDFALSLINKMARSTGRRISTQYPKLDAILPNGSRLNATIPPFSVKEPTFTIRKFNSVKFSPSALCKNNTFTTQTLAFLWMAIESDCSFMICGNTGSGKTTSLNALFCFVPKEDRIVVAEDTPELFVPHKHVARLASEEKMNITMQDLIINSLRMRPDRIIVGEIRKKKEVEAFIETLLAGQGKGSYATFHSNSAQEAVKRMKMLGTSEMDLEALDLIIVQKRHTIIDKKTRMRKEKRNVLEVTEILPGKKGVRLNTLYEYDFSKNFLKAKNKSKKVKRKILSSFSLNEKELNKELKKREKFLEKLTSEKDNLEIFFEKASGDLN